MLTALIVGLSLAFAALLLWTFVLGPKPEAKARPHARPARPSKPLPPARRSSTDDLIDPTSPTNQSIFGD